jgi:hypothetical protein
MVRPVRPRDGPENPVLIADSERDRICRTTNPVAVRNDVRQCNLGDCRKVCFDTREGVEPHYRLVRREQFL